ncbi:MAG TPA: hypothetical protein DEQ61_20375 [Streptomyces sp.]|nr:hypothetical protein [Streptomyces sp.]
MGVRGHDRGVEPTREITRSGRRQPATHCFARAGADEALRTAGLRGGPSAVHVRVLPNGEPW